MVYFSPRTALDPGHPPTSWVAALESLLPPGQDAPIEDGGATAVFERIAREPIVAEVLTTPGYVLTDRERAALPVTGPDDVACRRWGLLCTKSAGIPVGQITAGLRPQLLPQSALDALAITPSGDPLPGSRSVVPLGRALHGLGVRRHQLEVTPTPGRKDAAGNELILYSEALLTLPGPPSLPRVPFAMVTERVYLEFADAFPVPWLPWTRAPGLDTAAAAAAG